MAQCLPPDAVYKPAAIHTSIDELAPAGGTLFVSSSAFEAEGAKRTGARCAFVDLVSSSSDRDFGCAGINRQEEEDENALHRRSSDPR
jgi:hypothetical protein